MRPPSFLLALAWGVAIVGAAVAGAQPAPPFTYQGELAFDGQLVTNSCDLQFTLYDALSAGSIVAGPSPVPATTVVEGRFNAELSGWPASSWEGTRWLEIAVACPAGGPLTPLSPRRLVTSAPAAALAWAVGSGAVGESGLQPGAVTSAKLGTGAVTAGKIALGAVGAAAIDAAEVQRRIGTGCAPGSSIGAVEADGAVVCEPDDGGTDYTAGTGLALTDAEFRAQGSPFGNVVVVAKSGGNFSAVQAALDSIQLATPENPYLVYVAPGVYSGQVTLKPYVTLLGAGEGATILRWHGGSQDPVDGVGSATLIGATNSRVSQLTVESQAIGTEPYTVAIHNSSQSPTMSHLRATASGGLFNTGVFNGALVGWSAPILSHMTVTASGGSCMGVRNHSAGPIMSEMTVNAQCTWSYGVENFNSAPTMSDVSVQASGTNIVYGVANTGSTTEMSNVIVTAPGFGYVLYGFSSLVTVRTSVLIGDYIYSDETGEMKIANSQLVVGALSTDLTCFGSYDQNLAAVTCP